MLFMGSRLHVGEFSRCSHLWVDGSKITVDRAVGREKGVHAEGLLGTEPSGNDIFQSPLEVLFSINRPLPRREFYVIVPDNQRKLPYPTTNRFVRHPLSTTPRYLVHLGRPSPRLLSRNPSLRSTSTRYIHIDLSILFRAGKKQRG